MVQVMFFLEMTGPITTGLSSSDSGLNAAVGPDLGTSSGPASDQVGQAKVGAADAPGRENGTQLGSSDSWPVSSSSGLVFGPNFRVKKPNAGGPNGMSSVDVAPVSVGPAYVGPKDDGLVDVPHVAGPLPVPKGNMRDTGKIPVSNQFDSLGGPVLDDFDDFFDGVTGLWESERQTAHYYIEYGFKPPDFVFEKWSPKLEVYFSQLTKVDSTD
ncbi:hypothetical protein L1987_55195 [Smallanthus sonchifolius]|uniref:Uncharacterized protein n=1 Tax=Smallanthus sonchifolius TaxID=185202 RepID=A0ACB9E9Y2_9ASTR|nr:hypothetical protein L1987_55195 [Smallanthus sonchifolius]